MTFYKSIADYYDHIFKGTWHQLEFLGSSGFTISQTDILDIGCATGELAIALSKLGSTVAGIDLDPEMIRKANEKRGISQSNYPSFQQMDMLKIKKVFKKNSFDLISCFGNTLVHLNSNADIQSFLKQSKLLLKEGGRLVGQIVNYDRVKRDDIRSLPTIENEIIQFERTYNPARKFIEFETVLTIKESGDVIKNKIELYPVYKSDLEVMLKESGFKSVKFYGNFKKDAYSFDSLALIFEAIT